MNDRYGSDVLAPVAGADTHDTQVRRAPNAHRAPVTPQERAAAAPHVPANIGVVVEDVSTGWVGAVVRCEKAGGKYVVVLEDRHGHTRTFPLGPGFWIDGRPVILAPPAPAASALSQRPARTASGSRAVHGLRARVALPSRIWVEGKHDAELIEQVWGDDLRVEGVVVEMLDGVDNLTAALAEFGPTPQRRVGVLVDHLVPGSKEQRLADAALATVQPGTVLVLGHPYVDVWQAVLPARLGLKVWPKVARGIEWKLGVLHELGWPADSQADVAQAWQRIRRSVRDYRDLDPALLVRVEELIDFVTG